MHIVDLNAINVGAINARQFCIMRITYPVTFEYLIISNVLQLSNIMLTTTAPIFFRSDLQGILLLEYFITGRSKQT